LDKWKPSPDNRVRELTIAGALYLAEVERRELAGETVVGSRAKFKQCANKIERELKSEAIRQLKRSHTCLDKGRGSEIEIIALL
jgi:hypothetical protein